MRSLFRAEIERLKTEPVTPAELEQVKTAIKASLLPTLDSNMGMASILAEYEAKTGDWRNIFNELAKTTGFAHGRGLET